MRLQDGPRGLQQDFQDGPKRRKALIPLKSLQYVRAYSLLALRGPRPPGWPRERPRSFQDGSRTAQEAPKRPQGSSKTVQYGLRNAQDDLQDNPEAPHEVPSRPGEAPKTSSDGVGRARNALRLPKRPSRKPRKTSKRPKETPRGLHTPSPTPSPGPRGVVPRGVGTSKMNELCLLAPLPACLPASLAACLIRAPESSKTDQEGPKRPPRLSKASGCLVLF